MQKLREKKRDKTRDWGENIREKGNICERGGRN